MCRAIYVPLESVLCICILKIVRRVLYFLHPFVFMFHEASMYCAIVHWKFHCTSCFIFLLHFFVFTWICIMYLHIGNIRYVLYFLYYLHFLSVDAANVQIYVLIRLSPFVGHFIEASCIVLLKSLETHFVFNVQYIYLVDNTIFQYLISTS